MNFLIIQTAFIGDAILATSILESINKSHPDATIDFFIRKGNENLFTNHPFINQLFVWNKKEGKYKNLFSILKQVRKSKYDYVINLQRFATTGLFASLSAAKTIIGFKKNPFSMFFDQKYEHEIGNGKHEIERNHELIRSITIDEPMKPKLYPQKQDYELVKPYLNANYITISPASVWYTKQYPPDKWVEYIKTLDNRYVVYLLGGPSDRALCEEIKSDCKFHSIKVLAGELGFLASAALMQNAAMNFTNDSAPLHIATAMNARVTSVFCSTVSDFGFTPLSDHSKVVETQNDLSCRPCGLHGKKECPKGDFECAYSINPEQLDFTDIKEN